MTLDAMSIGDGRRPRGAGPAAPAPPRRRRDPLVAGLRRALREVDERELAGYLLGSLRALADVARAARRPGRGAGRRALDPWSYPDAVWQRVLRRDPALAAFPLGQATERAVKVTAAAVLRDAGLVPGGGAAGAERLEAALADAGRGGRARLGRRLLAAFLAELALDLLRRSRAGQALDSPYRYRFDGGPVLVPAERELAWRDGLAARAEELADALWPAVERALREPRPAAAGRRLAAAFVEHLGEPPVPSPAAPPAAGHDVEVLAPPQGYDQPGEIHVRLGARRGNLALDLRSLQPPRDRDAGEPPSLPPPALDLLAAAAALYVADRWLPRERHDGRRIRLRVEARDPQALARVAPRIEAMAAVLGRDDLVLTVDARAGGEAGSAAPAPPLPPPDAALATCLFSGGLDSLAGAAHLLAGGEGPLERLWLVSHYAIGNLAHTQRSLAEDLAAIHPGRVVAQRVFVGGSRSPTRGLKSPPGRRGQAQHLRSVLFLALAAASALHSGSRRIYVCENGPMALNPVVSEGRSYTRTAHPRLLDLFRRLLDELFGGGWTVANPFLYSTKGEAVAALDRPRLHGLVAASESCWNATAGSFRAGGERHDGTCLPCLVRRAACRRAGIAAHDAGYLREGFHLRELPTAARTLLADHLRFCATVAALPDRDLLAYAPDFSLDLPAVDPRRLAATWRRHGEELFAAIEGRGDDAMRTAFRRP